jgi:hypothetical protein
MIATKTTILVVAMAVIGIVPVAAHAQPTVNINELVEQSGTSDQVSAPVQDQDQAQIDEDRNTPVNVVFATVGPFGALTAPQTSIVDDRDTLASSQEQNQNASATQTPSQTQTPFQAPTFTVGDLLGVLPEGGG